MVLKTIDSRPYDTIMSKNTLFAGFRFEITNYGNTTVYVNKIKLDFYVSTMTLIFFHS